MEDVPPKRDNKDAYLGTQALRALSSSMSLVSTVLRFDIVELWSENELDGKLHCTYVHTTEEIQNRYPEIISGLYPDQKREHKVSPALCTNAKNSPQHYYWNVSDPAKITSNMVLSPLHPELRAPALTEMSVQIDGDFQGLKVYIVGFSLERLVWRPSKIKFLNGLGYAIYIAAVDFDADPDVENNSAENSESVELDIKDHCPRPLNAYYSTSVNIQEVMEDKSIASDEASSILDELNISRSRSRTFSIVSMVDEKIAESIVSEVSESSSLPPVVLGAPSWDPIDNFSFPVAEIPVIDAIADRISINDFLDVKHLTDGSNANIFEAVYHGKRVVIKMIKENIPDDSVAMQEFEIEHGILSRLSHPHIIRLLGAGWFPRRFIVLEWLGGGTLHSLLAQNQARSGLARRLIRKPTFTYANLLIKAKNIAEALVYLHSQLYPGACVIHRDLKPDNVGFTKDGKVQLFDFGLCACVKSRMNDTDAFELSGGTGSLRYMAPEVALKKPYNEKVDIYSFGIMVWQMARDRVPFEGFNRDEFFSRVVLGGERPKLDKTWPNDFRELLISCWHNDPLKRPSAQNLVAKLSMLIDDITGNNKKWLKKTTMSFMHPSTSSNSTVTSSAIKTS